jgi:head-tail adaptor
VGTINSGELDTRIRIEQSSPIKDGHGNTTATPSWALYSRVWAKATYLTGSDSRQAAQDSAVLKAVFRIRRTARTAA